MVTAFISDGGGILVPKSVTLGHGISLDVEGGRRVERIGVMK